MAAEKVGSVTDLLCAYGFVTFFAAIIGTIFSRERLVQTTIPETFAIALMWPMALVVVALIGFVQLAKRVIGFAPK